MINIINKADCCGCTACASVCSRNAIEMKPDALGFLYPEVNKELCNGCGLCERVCAFHPTYDKSLNLAAPDIYAVRHKEMGEIETSRSGAMFIAVSDWILEQGGVVYGVGYADHFRVAHKRAASKQERNEFKGSKYVQSDLGTTFREIRQELKAGVYVLFSGTPCQTSGLQSYLKASKADTTRLYMVDIICHGVPSPFFWRDYLAYIERKHGKEVTEVNFRDKSELGWAAHEESFKFGDERIYKHTYTHTFYKHIMLRKSCGKCHFTNYTRPSDITIADFWGWRRVDPTFNADNKGVSLVFANSTKGQQIFNDVKSSLNYIKTDAQSCTQRNLHHPTTLHRKSDSFERDYEKHGFKYVGRKYASMGLLGRLKMAIRKQIKKLKR